MLSTEELMKPRYKVIADYPNNNDFTLNKIVEFEVWVKCYWKHEVTDCQGTRTWLSEFFDLYPHLFKKLEWWEERKESDMPEYVKATNTGKVYKAIKHGTRGFLIDQNAWNLFHYDLCLPATKEDFLNQKTANV